jgi:hypothetical protein
MKDRKKTNKGYKIHPEINIKDINFLEPDDGDKKDDKKDDE